ncbi:MAG: hypothetical protein Q9162_002501 [Coniocarpon cinnabarinum]
MPSFQMRYGSETHVSLLESRLTDMECELRSLSQWKEQITSTIFGFATQPPRVKHSGIRRRRASITVVARNQIVPEELIASDLPKHLLSEKSEEGSFPTYNEEPQVIVTTSAVNDPGKDLVLNAERVALKDHTSSQDVTELAENILEVIQRYGQHTTARTDEHGSRAWAGKALFVSKVENQVRARQPVRMILPAFPWKSVNRVDKVISSLPDLGEVLALSRLNQLCQDIKSVYPLGGEVHLATDGLVFDGTLTGVV